MKIINILLTICFSLFIFPQSSFAGKYSPEYLAVKCSLDYENERNKDKHNCQVNSLTPHNNMCNILRGFSGFMYQKIKVEKISKQEAYTYTSGNKINPNESKVFNTYLLYQHGVIRTLFDGKQQSKEISVNNWYKACLNNSVSSLLNFHFN